MCAFCYTQLTDVEQEEMCIRDSSCLEHTISTDVHYNAWIAPLQTDDPVRASLGPPERAP